MMKSICCGLFGAFSGGIIGVIGAPAWEIAPFIVGLLGAVTGAVSAALAVHRRAGLAAGVLATTFGATAIYLMADGYNPAWVVWRSVAAIALAGTSGIVVALINRSRRLSS